MRYDEAWDPAVTDIGHALRMTVGATKKNATANISAAYAGVTKTAMLTVKRR